MKRDMDLVRQILLNAEAQEDGYVNENPELGGYSEEQIDHHVYLMKQAGLIDAIDITTLSSSSPTAILLSITWQGHDFLDAAKNSTVWAQAKEKAKSVGGSLSFELLKELLVATARSQLSLP